MPLSPGTTPLHLPATIANGSSSFSQTFLSHRDAALAEAALVQTKLNVTRRNSSRKPSPPIRSVFVWLHTIPYADFRRNAVRRLPALLVGEAPKLRQSAGRGPGKSDEPIAAFAPDSDVAAVRMR